jgi:IMP dehydrogenase/GMP reductase
VPLLLKKQFHSKELMMRTVKQMKASRLYHLELIALGMALAQVGDREKIAEKIDPSSIQSEIVASGLRAVASKDPADIRVMIKKLRNIGLSVEGNVTDAVIDKINLSNAQRRLEEALSTAATATGGKEIKEAVERVSRSWKSLETFAVTIGEQE